MPWKETCTVDERIEFVQEVLRGELGKSELCRRYGISRPTGDKWLERFHQRGLAGMEDLSSAPHCHSNQVPEELADMLISLRRQHMTWGPRKLLAYLERRYAGVKWPAASTVGELIRHNGMSRVRKPRHRTPPYTQPFGSCQNANAIWCADFKGWFRTSDQTICHPLTITDAFSRYLLRCHGMERAQTAPTKVIFESAFREYGLPQAIRTDNGTPFASNSVGGLSRLSVWWLKLGIVPERIEPGQPQQNGRHERMHLTLKQDTASPPRSTMRSQQRRFDEFRVEYNQQRPHEALDQKTPADLYQPSPRPYPSRVPEPEYGGDMKIRYVRHSGEIKWQGRRMYLGEVLAKENVGLEQVAEDHWLIYFCKMPLGVLDDQRRKVWSVEAATRKGWLMADALPSPFRCAPGTGQSVEM
jgi:putative transposase